MIDPCIHILAFFFLIWSRKYFMSFFKPAKFQRRSRNGLLEGLWESFSRTNTQRRWGRSHDIHMGKLASCKTKTWNLPFLGFASVCSKTLGFVSSAEEISLLARVKSQLLQREANPFGRFLRSSHLPYSSEPGLSEICRIVWPDLEI